jgi:hypothetical protein
MRRAPLLVALLAVILMGSACGKSATTNSGAATFSGTYALTVKPNFCGPTGNHPGQIMYVGGLDVTVPSGDQAGPFTGKATRHGSGYHLVLLQPANEIMDDITITLSGGGDDVAGTGQVNLEAGNNPPCSISFTGHRTSTSVPPSTSTSVAAVGTTVPPAP